MAKKSTAASRQKKGTKTVCLDLTISEYEYLKEVSARQNEGIQTVAIRLLHQAIETLGPCL